MSDDVKTETTTEGPFDWFDEEDLRRLMTVSAYEWPDGAHPVATDGDLEIARAESLAHNEEEMER